MNSEIRQVVHRNLNSHCLSLYGGALITCRQLTSLEVAFNNILRQIWRLPINCHTCILHILTVFLIDLYVYLTKRPVSQTPNCFMTPLLCSTPMCLLQSAAIAIVLKIVLWGRPYLCWLCKTPHIINSSVRDLDIESMIQIICCNKLGRAWTSPTLVWSTETRASTDWLFPSHSRDTDTLHVPTLPCQPARASSWEGGVCGRDYATLMWTVRCVVVIAARPRTLTMGKWKSRDTLATNYEAGMRERPANLFILVLPYCRCHHLGFHILAGHFTQTLIYINLIILDKTCAHVMCTGVHRLHPLT